MAATSPSLADPLLQSPPDHAPAADRLAAPVPPRRLPFGVADVLLVVFVLGILQRSQGSMLDDPGLGWHLRNVDAMLAEGGALTRDVFSYPVENWPWRTNQWVGDLALWAGWHWGGLEGIAAVTALVLGLTFCGLYGMLVADDVPWPWAAGWTFLAALGTSLSWVARPNVFSIPLVMVTAWTCDRYHRGWTGAATTWWLAPLFAVWVNTHGGFLAGLLIVAVTLAVEILLALGVPHGKDRAGARRRARHLALLFAAAIAATLLNPYGWEIYPWTLSLLGNDYFMSINTEWQSPDFHGLGAWRFEVFMLLLPALLALSRRRPSLVALAHSLVLLHFAFAGQRYVALWVVATAPLVARLSVRVPLARGLTERMRRLGPAVPNAVGRGRWRWLGTALVVLGLAAWSRLVEGYSYHAPKNLPVAALEVALAHADERPMFHHYNWGGWIVWHGWPRVRNWIDDRNEVHGRRHIEEYFALIDAAPGWEETFRRRDVALVCIPPSKPLARRLSEHPTWRELYRDEHAVVFQRREQGASR